MSEIGSDIIDLRDLWKQKEELEAIKGSLEDDGELLDDEAETLEQLTELFVDVGEPFAGGEFDEPMLILDSYFEDYARQYAEEVGAIEDDARWPATCIDWEKAASELQMDYTAYEIGSHTYWRG